VTGLSLTENDTHYASAVADYNVPFAFVRSKCDDSLRSEYENDKGVVSNVDKEKFKAQGVSTFRKYLNAHPHEALQSSDLFFISSVVLHGKPKFKKYQLDEKKLLTDVVYKVMHRRNPGAECVATYLNDMFSKLDLEPESKWPCSIS